MAISKVNLWNIAVGVCGGAKSGLIQSEDDDTTVADLCREFWEESVDQALIYIKPKEASRYREIAETSDSPDDCDWSYVYKLRL